MASTYLTKTMGNPPGNSRIGTFSFWIKFSGLSTSADKYLFSTYENSNNRTLCKFNTDGAFEFQARSGGNLDLRYDTNRVFRDTNAWYNIVIATDTTQSTASNRVKIYVNGVQETSFATSTVPSQNVVPHYLYGGIVRYIGVYGDNLIDKWDGLMSYVAFIDGTQELPTVFGETDSTTGEWKIKTTITPSSAWGDNGYLILKDGNSVTDQSGEGNNFTVNGTLTKTEDNPSNVFATYNPLIPNTGNLTFSNGNTTITDSVGSGSWTQTYGVSTLGMTSGKYYAETKVINIGTDQVYPLGLIKDIESTAITTSVGSQSNPGIAYYSDGRIISNGNDVQTGLHNLSGNGDIIGLAFDATNGTAQWYRNGATLGTQVTGLSTTGTWYFVSNGYQDNVLSANFGNGYFGTTAVSSAGANASGIGIFEYDVPANFTALSTKGLNL